MLKNARYCTYFGHQKDEYTGTIYSCIVSYQGFKAYKF